jgi:hypothetical protein
MDSRYEELFLNPRAEYRSIPFWAWNDKLEEKELIYQIKEMKQQGIGGFFMHSREGLETEYLSEEWMKLIKTCVEIAKEEGMEAWLYDEDRWPSGTAGGKITRKGGDDSRCKGLTIEVCTELKVTDEISALFKAKVKGMDIIECKKLQLGNSHNLNQDEVYLAFRIEVSEPSEWFNDEAPPDNLNSKSVKGFIDSTYEAYKVAVGNEFGKTVKGIFTDEPSLADKNSKFNAKRGWIPWTYEFTKYFKEKRGYEILDFVPYIYFNGDKSSFIRHDYWRTVTELFCESYSKQIGEWCKKNNFNFTGHFLQEDKLGLSTRVSGAVMPHYVYQHVPGIDMLCEKTDEYLTVRQCTSVANQFGKKTVITETYGCTGWDFTFEGQKWIGDWQFVMGVNRRCQHLALYSIKGCRKRDYPPVFNYNTSWWKYDKVVEDYFARLSAVLTQGKVVRDILVLHPSTSAWSMLGTDPYGNPKRSKERDIPKINQYGDEFNSLLKHLMAVHYDFDLGDELIIEKEGAIRDNKFYVKFASYKMVVLPPLKTLLKSTFELLIQFLNAGGTVLALKPFASMIEGRENSQLNKIFKHKNLKEIDNYTELSLELEKVLTRTVSIKNEYGQEAPELFYMLKEIEDFKALFIVNNNRNQSFEVNIELSEKGIVEEWDALSGKCYNADFNNTEQGLCIKSNFKGGASKLYIIKNNEDSLSFKKQNKEQQSGRTLYTSLGQVCSFTRTIPNSIILDKCSYKIEDGLWSEEMDLWKAQKNIRDNLGMRQIYYNGIPQRYKWINKSHPKDGTDIELLFNFTIKDLPTSEVYAVLESSENFSIKLNGNEIENVKRGYFIDKSFDKILLEGLLKGNNELILSCSYRENIEIEDCYLIGAFGVDVNRTIIKEPSVLRFGDWCLQGYPHYAGSMVYHFDFECDIEDKQKLLLECDKFSATVIEVRVNDKQAGFIPWKANNIVDITEFVVSGKNKVDIEVMGSMRNLLGPFHQRKGNGLKTDWSSFRTDGENYTEDYNLKAYGIFDLIKLYK